MTDLALRRARPIWNCSARKIGGIWFVRLGRIVITFTVKRAAQSGTVSVRPKGVIADSSLPTMDHATNRRTGAITVDAPRRMW